MASRKERLKKLLPLIGIAGGAAVLYVILKPALAGAQVSVNVPPPGSPPGTPGEEIKMTATKEAEQALQTMSTAQIKDLAGSVKAARAGGYTKTIVTPAGTIAIDPNGQIRQATPEEAKRRFK